MEIIRKSIIYWVLLCLVGCGFKPMEVPSPYFQSCQIISNDDYGEVVLQLKQKLKMANVNIVKRNPDLIVTIKTDFNAYTENTESSILARLWKISYQAEVSLQKRNQTKLLPRFLVEHNFYLQPNELFENSEQLKLTKEETAQQLVALIWQTLVIPW